jgi:hypothetical protein
MYSVKNVRVRIGRQGFGFVCDLYRDGKKVAYDVEDRANGGCFIYRWVNDSGQRYKEEALFHEASKAKHSGPEPKDYFMSELVNEAVIESEYKRDIGRE